MRAVADTLAVVLAQVNINPDGNAIPGGPQVQQVVNGLASLALLVGAAAALIGLGLWGFGALTTNPMYVTVGKRAALLAVAAAAIIGMLPTLINWGFGLGGQVTVPGGTP